MPNVRARLLPSLLLTGGVLAYAACASTSVTSDRDSTIPIPKAAKVAFVGGTDATGIDPAVRNDIVHRRIQTAIKNELTAKGFQLVENEADADFLVRYFVGMHQSTEYVSTTTGYTGGWGYGYGWGWGGGVGMATTTTTPYTVRDAKFVVDLVTAKDEKLAWRGELTGEAPDHPPSQEEVDGGVGRTMQSLKPGE
jgi:hypothetical protein